MQIFFQSKKIELHSDDQDFMARRLENLSKFFSRYAQVFVDVEKTLASHNDNQLFYIAIHLEDGSVRYFVNGYHEDIRKTFDHVYADLYRSIRNSRSKSRTMLKSTGRKFKQIFKRKAR